MDAWAPGANNYRSQFVSKDSDEALTDIITGIGEMSRGELAGERMNVAYEERSQEDEHSCFADNTNADIIANALGVQRVYLGEYGEVSGPGIKDLIATEDEDLAESLAAEINRSVTLARSIPTPFDSLLKEGTAGQRPGPPRSPGHHSFPGEPDGLHSERCRDGGYHNQRHVTANGPAQPPGPFPAATAGGSHPAAGGRQRSWSRPAWPTTT